MLTYLHGFELTFKVSLGGNFSYLNYSTTTWVSFLKIIIMISGMSRRGKPRGPPGSKSFVTALKGCQDKFFIDFIRR